jgi:hypothetical protein
MMSRLVVAVLIVIGLVIVSHVKGTEPPRRCCNDPGHRTGPENGELMYCPVRDR